MRNGGVPAPAFEPMLAGTWRRQSLRGEWRYEPKLDGWRALVYLDERGLTVRSRTGRNITLDTGELAGIAEALAGRSVVLDGELIAGAGTAEDFYSLTPRMVTRRGSPRACPVTFVAFDVLWLGGVDACDNPYEARRAALEDLGLNGPCWQVVDALDCDPADLLHACLELGVEGIVAKRASGRYRPGQRSDDWLKIKTPAWRSLHAGLRAKR